MTREDSEYAMEVQVGLKLPSKFWTHTMTCNVCGRSWSVNFETGDVETMTHAPDCKVGLMVAEAQGTA